MRRMKTQQDFVFMRLVIALPAELLDQVENFFKQLWIFRKNLPSLMVRFSLTSIERNRKAPAPVPYTIAKCTILRLYQLNHT
ncbi:hypothetical protein D3C73_1154520 [compost metagenome]